MPGDFEKSPPPKDIFVTIDPFPLRGSRDERPILTERIEAVCSEHPDHVVNSVIPIMSHGENSLTLFLLHLRRDDGDLSEDVSELRKKVDILVRMVSFMPDVRVRISSTRGSRFEMPDGWDDELRDVFG